MSDVINILSGNISVHGNGVDSSTIEGSLYVNEVLINYKSTLDSIYKSMYELRKASDTVLLNGYKLKELSQV